MKYPTRPHTSLWVPVWLYTPKHILPNGHLKPGNRMFYLDIISLVTPYIGLVIASYISVWYTQSLDQMDALFCPSIVECYDPCIVVADPDITGIGVRLASYIQAYCGIILLGLFPESEDTWGVRITTVMASLTLVFTTVIYALLGKLSLHHAIIVKTLLAVIMLPMHIVEPWRVKSPILYLAQQVRFAAYIALSLWLNLKTLCLGSDPQCNLCTRSMTTLFIPSRAISVQNRLWGILDPLYLMVLWLESNFWTYGIENLFLAVPALLSRTKAARWVGYVEETQRTLSDWRKAMNKEAKTVSCFWRIHKEFYFVSHNTARWYNCDDTMSERRRAAQWAQTAFRSQPNSGPIARVWRDIKIAVRVPRVQKALFGLILVTLWVRAVEETVKMNVSKKASEWGFGQIVALMSSIPAVLALAKFLMRLGYRKKDPSSITRVKTYP